MTVRIGSNIASLTVQRRLKEATELRLRSFERLSSGLRINRASDDAAGLSIAESLNTEARVLSQAVRNANDGISFLSIAEGALRELSSIVLRISELAEQSANGVYNQKQRQALDREGQALAREYDRIVSTTEFNGLSLLDGSSGPADLQVGTSSARSSQITASVGSQLNRTTGDGTFQSAVDIEPVGSSITSAKTADYDGDGHLDIAIQADSGGGLYIRYGNGDGTFEDNVVLPPLGFNQGVSLTSADVDNDGDLDFAFWGNGSELQLVENLGSRNFAAGQTIDIGVGGGTGLIFGDLNGDNKLDIVGSEYATDSIRVFIGNGDGTFTAPATYAETGNSLSVALGDLDGDGDLDIVSGIAGSVLRVRMNTGSGTYGAATNVAISSQSSIDYISDLDGDGRADLVLGSTGAFGDLAVYFGNGNGTFKNYSALVTNRPASSQVLTDLNGDGKIDIFGSEDGNALVFIGNGNGTFVAPVSYASGQTVAYNGSVGDVNEDGALDLLFPTYLGQTVALFLANTQTVGGLTPFSLLSQDDALAALDAMRESLTRVNSALGAVGSIQSRLGVAVSNAHTSRENYMAAGSRIIDADVGAETVTLTRSGILQSAAAALLAQANLQPQLALQLLQGP